MIKIRIYAISDLGAQKIREYVDNIKPRDKWFMKRMGTTVDVSEDHKEIIINLNQIEIKALTYIRNNPTLRKQYEEDLAKKSMINLEKELTKLEIVKDTDYTIDEI